MTTNLSREAQVARVFAELADVLVDEFDVIEALTVVTLRCVDVLNADAAGLLLAKTDGQLSVVAASSDEAQLLELIAIQSREGPCVEAYRTGAATGAGDLEIDGVRWPDFTDAATAMDFRSAHALPLRARGEVVGALGMFAKKPDAFTADDVVIAQALADVATVSLLQHRAVSEQRLVSTQLQNALDTRVVIEQAKGVIAGQTGWSMAEAFDALRSYARSSSRRLADVAAEVVDGGPAVESLKVSRRPSQP